MGVQEYNLHCNPLILLEYTKNNNILTNEKTNRALRVFQPFYRYYRRIILQDELRFMVMPSVNELFIRPRGIPTTGNK